MTNLPTGANIQPAVDLAQAGQFVDRAIRAVVPPGQMLQQRMRPESTVTWEEPAPLAGFHAAQTVARLAQRRVYEYAEKLRGAGVPWVRVADLLEVPYSDEYSRAERAYELVAGPPQGNGPWDQPTVYWQCGGPTGCGQQVTDRGPYEAHPADNERGHADNCRRAAAEAEAYQREREARDRRGAVSHAAFSTLSSIDRATVQRCWSALRRGGQISGKWAFAEQLAVALVLGDEGFLTSARHTRQEAILRVYDTGPGDGEVLRRLAVMREAATGETSEQV